MQHWPFIERGPNRVAELDSGMFSMCLTPKPSGAAHNVPLSGRKLIRDCSLRMDGISKIKIQVRTVALSVRDASPT